MHGRRGCSIAGHQRLDVYVDLQFVTTIVHYLFDTQHSFFYSVY
jgi:hypothetical protein